MFTNLSCIKLLVEEIMCEETNSVSGHIFKASVFGWKWGSWLCKSFPELLKIPVFKDRLLSMQAVCVDAVRAVTAESDAKETTKQTNETHVAMRHCRRYDAAIVERVQRAASLNWQPKHGHYAHMCANIFKFQVQLRHLFCSMGTNSFRRWRPRILYWNGENADMVQADAGEVRHWKTFSL